MSEQERREALSDDAAWASGYAAGRAAERATTAALREAAQAITDNWTLLGHMPTAAEMDALRAALAADGAAGETER